MRVLAIGVMALSCTLGVFVSAARPEDEPAKDEIHVLFIGNSLTFVNDLPKMTSELAKAGKQRPLQYQRHTPGGCTLERHWTEGKALAKIQSRKWDFVVLQEHRPVAQEQREKMFEYGKKLDAEITKNGAKTILYMTWARQNMPDELPTISKPYLDLSKELKSQLAPVGVAWGMALQADKKLSLHRSDRRHPNPTGTYLAACVFYATIYSKSPEGLPGNIGDLTDAEAKPLQAIAWKVVQKTEK
jgi:hypothetical protein